MLSQFVAERLVAVLYKMQLQVVKMQYIWLMGILKACFSDLVFRISLFFVLPVPWRGERVRLWERGGCFRCFLTTISFSIRTTFGYRILSFHQHNNLQNSSRKPRFLAAYMNGFIVLLRKKNTIVNCTIRGAVSGEKRFHNKNAHISIQQSRNPPAT